MTLSFSTRWGKNMGDLAGQPNYFVEKIMFSLYMENPRSIVELDKLYRKTPNTECDSLLEIISLRKHEFHPKLHSIREDKSNRWMPGMKIHMVINNRTRNRYQFAPLLEVESVQTIRIIREGPGVEFGIGTWYVYIDDRQLTLDQIKELAWNDGFDSVPDFFDFFNSEFTGKIIHWTNLKY